jgi:hypothetical protein
MRTAIYCAVFLAASSLVAQEDRTARSTEVARFGSLSLGVSFRSRDTGTILGNYAVRVCRGGPCSTDRDKGVLRLLLIDLDRTLADSLQRYIDKSRGDAKRRISGVGCYALQRVLADSETVAGWGARRIVWQYDPETAHVWIPAGGSTDESYEIEARLTKGLLSGVGRSQFGAGPREAIDTIVGQRVGPPDSTHCDRAYPPGGAHRPASFEVFPCDTLIANLDREGCFRDTLAANERALAQAERAIRDSLDFPARAGFDSAASLWRAYRTQECEATYDHFDDPRVHVVVLLGCEISVTRDRLRRLPDLYLNVSGKRRTKPL